MINCFDERDCDRKEIGHVIDTILENLPGDISGTIGELLERDLFSDFNKGYSATEKLRNFNGNGIPKSSNAYGNFNLFPCSRKGPIRDLFLCICGGKTTFAKAMQEIVKYCRLTEKYIQLKKKKSVVLVTDKWHQEQFSKYSAEIKDFCLGENIDFYFLLVTDYGATKLAYFDMYWGNHFDDKNNFYAGVPSDYEIALGKIGKWASFNEGNGTYIIDFEKKTLECDGQIVCDYISKSILAEFVFDLTRYLNWRGDGSGASKVADIYLYNTRITANAEVGIGRNLCDIFRRLIDSCQR